MGLGYSSADIEQIMREFVVISQSPLCLFNFNECTILNFASASDTSVPYNTFIHMKDPVQFFTKYNLIMTESIRKNHESVRQKIHIDPEHTTWRLCFSQQLSKPGQQVTFLLMNALRNAITLDKIQDIHSLFAFKGEKFNGHTPLDIFNMLKRDSVSVSYNLPQSCNALLLVRIFTNFCRNRFGM